MRSPITEAVICADRRAVTMNVPALRFGLGYEGKRAFGPLFCCRRCPSLLHSRDARPAGYDLPCASFGKGIYAHLTPASPMLWSYEGEPRSQHTPVRAAFSASLEMARQILEHAVGWNVVLYPSPDFSRDQRLRETNTLCPDWNGV